MRALRRPRYLLIAAVLALGLGLFAQGGSANAAGVTFTLRLRSASNALLATAHPSSISFGAPSNSRGSLRQHTLTVVIPLSTQNQNFATAVAKPHAGSEHFVLIVQSAGQCVDKYQLSDIAPIKLSTSGSTETFTFAFAQLARLQC